MDINYTIVLGLNLLVLCTAFSQLPMIKIETKAIDAVTALRQAAASLNVPVPANWFNLMGLTASSGSYGQANVAISTVEAAMTNWAIPEQFRDQAVRSVRLLALAATEGTYSAQTFLFDIASGASLTTLIVVATKLSSPVDPNLPISIMYATINTYAIIKQQYSYWTARVCHRCPKCMWLRDCCCHDETRSAPRGHTPNELNDIKQKMTADQFIWFNEQNLPSSKFNEVDNLQKPNDNADKTNPTLTEVIEHYLSNTTAQTEVLASYNDSIISAIQANLTSLKLSSQALKMDKIQKENIRMLLTALADDYGFDDIYSNPNYTKELESPRFSYETLFTSETSSDNKSLVIKYIWILGEFVNNSTYTINFLSVNMNSTNLLDTMLLNNETNSVSLQTINHNKQISIVRTATLNSNGEFFNERLMQLIMPWQTKTATTVLNMLRFLGASIWVPKTFRMLSRFAPEIILPGNFRSATNGTTGAPSGISSKIMALASSVSTVLGTFKDIIQTLKSSKSITIERVVRFGFNYFNQKSTVMKVIDIPNSQVRDFVNAVIIDYNLPAKGSFMLGLTYSSDFAWEQVQYLYSPSMDGKYRSLTLFKNGDSTTNTASFFIVDIDADWTLAPDLLMITQTKSSFGGIYTSTKQSIQEVPHMLTIDEAFKLQQFFMLIAIGNMANQIGVNATIPQIN